MEIYHAPPATRPVSWVHGDWATSNANDGHLLRPVNLRRPDVRRHVGHHQVEAVWSDTDAPHGVHFQRRKTVVVVDVDWFAEGLSHGIEGLRPDAGEGIAIGDVIQEVTGRRPPRRADEVPVFGNRDPFVRWDRPVAHGSDEESRGLVFQGLGVKPMMQGIGRRISRVGDRDDVRLGREYRGQNTVDPDQCSPADVHGIYAVTYQGIYMMPQPNAPQPVPVPVSTIAPVSIDYQGQLSGHGTISMAGNAMEYAIVDRTIDVKPDCSAVVQMSVKSGSLADEGKSWVVVLEGGNELWAIQTESSVAKPIVTGTWKRISPIPSWDWD